MREHLKHKYMTRNDADYVLVLIYFLNQDFNLLYNVTQLFYNVKIKTCAPKSPNLFKTLMKDIHVEKPKKTTPIHISRRKKLEDGVT